MTIEKEDAGANPLHVHVDDATPVHVHVKKPKRPHNVAAIDARLAESKTKSASSFGASNLRRSTASATSRSKSPGRTGPWVPPPARSSKINKVSWQGPSHRLEINRPEDADAVAAALHMSDLSTDEEDRVHGKMRNYERKIDGLMSEVGSLKNEVELQRTFREIERKQDLLDQSRHVLEEQEAELYDTKKELDMTEAENKILRKSMDKLRDETEFTLASQPSDCSRTENEQLMTDREELLKKLVEVEMDGQAASKQVAALRDYTRRLREEKRMSSGDSAMLSKQKELLMDRLADFEAANRSLRRLLRDAHRQESLGLRLSEQRDVLLKKLSEADETAQRYRADAMEKERQLTDLRMQLHAQKDENVALSGLQGSLETTRGHLQKQLRSKEGDCNRMAVQIRNLESQLAQERIEVDHLQQLLGGAKEKADRDKEALKKATRIQKQRASRSEDTVEQLNSRLLERENELADMRSHVDRLRTFSDKHSKEKAQVVAENSALKTRISELELLLDRVEETSKTQIESSTAQLHDKIGETSVLKLENERLKTSMLTIEEKLSQAVGEVSQLRGSLRQYETLVEEYRSQMQKSRRETDDVACQLEEVRQESTRIQREGDLEMDKVRVRLQQRLQELEPLPEMLRTTELKLQDANERLLVYEKRSTDTIKQIAELQAKLDHQEEQADSMRDKWHTCQDENRALVGKVELLERKVRDSEDQAKELLGSLAKREEQIHLSNVRLDEKTRENASLTRQLESALSDLRQQSSAIKDKAASKERNLQSRILELESQISSCRAEVSRLKREKDEAERRSNSRVYDLKDQLSQAHSTNRSMQNYVQFLKNSYANVFGDPAVSVPYPGSPLRAPLI